MFATLSNLVDRNFVLAFVLPTLIGSVCVLLLLGDILPPALQVTALTTTDDFAKLTTLVLILWSLAVLLSVFSNPIYQLLEGYWGPLRTAGRLCAKQRAFDTVLAGIERTQDRLTRNEAVRRFRANWPPRRDLVLPTRFGNVIRAFENYANTVYGPDGIATWPRLFGVLPVSLTDAIEAARAQVSFFVNLCLMASVVAAVALTRGGIDLAHWAQITSQWDQLPRTNLIVAALSLIATRALYEAAIAQAYGWGSLVMAAFDLYLPALAKQLGYGLGNTTADRRSFWRTLNGVFLHHQEIDPTKWPAAGDTDHGPDVT